MFAALACRPRSLRGRVCVVYAAVAAVAAAEGRQRAIGFGGVEIGPVETADVPLGVGALPGEEVGEPVLAGRADDEIGLGQARGVEMAADQRVVDLLGGD